MVLYTPIPKDIIFPIEPQQQEYYRCGTGILCGNHKSDGFHVIRIISTDLTAYTHNSVTVGSVFSKKK